MEVVSVGEALKKSVIDGKEFEYKVYDHVQFQKCKVTVPLFEELDENSFYALTSFNRLTENFTRMLSLYYPKAVELIKQLKAVDAIRHLRFYTALAYYQLTVEIFKKFSSVKVYEDELLNYDYRRSSQDLLLLDKISLFKGRNHVGFLTVVAVEKTPMIAAGIVKPKNVSVIPQILEQEVKAWLQEPLTKEFFLQNLMFVGKEKINEYSAEVTLSVLSGRYSPNLPAGEVRASIVNYFHGMQLRLSQGRTTT